MLLETWGHQVDEAADGRQGLERARAGEADIALVDVGLPGLDGYAVARALREDPSARRLHLVAVTGYGQPADRERARAAGFDALLIKPIDPDQLARVLAERPDLR
jgi:CheY-like chemotaxis protein